MSPMFMCVCVLVSFRAFFLVWASPRRGNSLCRVSPAASERLPSSGRLPRADLPASVLKRSTLPADSTFTPSHSLSTQDVTVTAISCHRLAEKRSGRYERGEKRLREGSQLRSSSTGAGLLRVPFQRCNRQTPPPAPPPWCRTWKTRIHQRR